jgi:hypothetical protein
MWNGMNRTRLSVITSSAGLVAVTASVLMAFLSDHHWYVGDFSLLPVPLALFAGTILVIGGKRTS